MSSHRFSILAFISASTFALALFAPVAALADGSCVGEPEILLEFVPGLETPEGVTIDYQDRLYLPLAFTAEIVRVGRDGSRNSVADLGVAAPGEGCFGPGSTPALLGPIAFDWRGNLYAGFNACEPKKRGVWKITPTGEAERIAAFGFDSLLNGIVRVGRTLYVADSFLGVIWSLPLGGGDAQVWFQDSRLDPVPGVFAPGANGLQFFRGEIYVAGSASGAILAVERRLDGSAGAVRQFAQLETGCDDFDLDIFGALYCTTGPENTVIRVARNGDQRVILDAGDGLDSPAQATFGRFGRDLFHLYVANAAFPYFGNDPKPSLMRVPICVPGAPLR